MKKRIIIFISLCLLLIAASPSFYQFERKETSLKLSPHTLSFHAADPDVEPLIPSESSIQIEIKVDSSREWRLTFLANGDLKGPKGSSIPVENITWQTTPSPPFLEGQLSKRSPQLAAQGRGETQVNGEIFFYLKNSWDYQAGEYSQTISLTLTCF